MAANSDIAFKRLPVKIIGTGSYVPERRLTNADLEKMVDTCLLYTSDAADE